MISLRLSYTTLRQQNLHRHDTLTSVSDKRRRSEAGAIHTTTGRANTYSTRPLPHASTTTRPSLSADIERKVMSILFADVKESMALSRSVALEDWWTLIAGVIDELCGGVAVFGGWVGSCTGDGIMAVFESGTQTNDHARRACEAALSLRDALRRRAAAISRECGLGLAVRIGVNSGEVLTGTVGAGHGRCYTAAGYAVALAKRIETLAAPGSVCVSEHTALLVAHTVQLDDLGAFDVRGAPAKVRIFELTGPTLPFA